MKFLIKTYRLFHIQFILAKYGCDEILLAHPYFSSMRFLSYLNPWYWLKNRRFPPEERLCLALESLGPIFIKLGQMLSTRPDLLPENYVRSLSRLQDKVRPFPQAKQRISQILGEPVDVLFKDFEEKAMASASIAQVHAARLLTGEAVVVKIRRAGIEKIVQRDIALLYSFARLLEKYTLFGKKIKAIAFIREFENMLQDELDLQREAANASMLRKNFLHSKQLYVPQIYWKYCRRELIVMERIYGISIANHQQLKAHGINFKKLAENSIQLFFTQIFRDCFFHADLHPGNLFVNPNNPLDPQLIIVDFGIVGSLSKQDQRYLAENLFAFFNRDYQRVAELHLASGWIPKDTSLIAFQMAISTVCEPIFQKAIKDISFAQLLMRLFQTGKQFHMEIQPQLLLLQKTFLHIESLTRQICPEIDLWATAEPIITQWMKEQMGIKASLRKIKQNLPRWIDYLIDFPELLHSKLKS